MAIATTELAEVRAGTTWAWDKSLPDYLSPTWVLTYYLKNATAQIQIVATAGVGGIHSVAVLPAANGAYAAGAYDWIGVVASGANKYESGTGRITVLANVVNTDVLDQRSHARKALAMIEAYLENGGNLTAAAYTIAGRSLNRYPITEVIKMREKYAAAVAGENTADRIRQGHPARNRILTRFTS